LLFILNNVLKEFQSKRYKMATLGDELIDAAKLGYIDRVGALLDQGVVVDSRDGEHMTPLMHASQSGHKAITALLLDRMANVNAETGEGDTATILASQGGYLDILQLLVSKGANIDHTVCYKFSSLYYAAIYDHLSVCEYLLSLGANLIAPIYNKMAVLNDYGIHARPRISPESKAIRRAALKKWWEKGPHPSQIKRRRDECWARRGPLLTVLAEHAYRPLQARALEIALAALSLNPIEAIVISTNPKEVVLRDEGLVRYIVAFM
jgi:Ankyrin repeats (3 copies)